MFLIGSQGNFDVYYDQTRKEVSVVNIYESTCEDYNANYSVEEWSEAIAWGKTLAKDLNFPLN